MARRPPRNSDHANVYNGQSTELAADKHGDETECEKTQHRKHTSVGVLGPEVFSFLEPANDGGF